MRSFVEARDEDVLNGVSRYRELNSDICGHRHIENRWNSRTEHACSLHATDNSSKSARSISPRMYHVICSVVKRKPCISHRQLVWACVYVCVSNRFVRVSNWWRRFFSFKEINEKIREVIIYLFNVVSDDLKDDICKAFYTRD